MYICIYLYIYTYVYISIYLSIYLSILSIYLSIYHLHIHEVTVSHIFFTVQFSINASTFIF